MDNSVRNGVCAIVEYDYSAKEPDELTLQKGYILHSIKVQPGGWWEGTLPSGKSGMFPDNFVKVLEPDELNPVVLRDKSATVNRRCKAVYSYTQNNNDELTLAVGDVIEFLGEVEEGWWRGKLGTKIGVFPSNFVSMVENPSPILANRRSNVTSVVAIAATPAISTKHKSQSREDLVASTSNLLASLEKDAPILPPKPVRELCKVLYPYGPSNEDELELKEGEIITILSRDLPDKGWWKGELKGKVGVFPDNFVTLISPESSPTSDSAPPHHKPDRPPPANSKMLITNNKTSTTFGSKDSLNDTGIITTGNVAAYRKSLENKVLDISGGSGGPLVEKGTRKSFEAKNDFRKSLENLDEKSKNSAAVPPPVLTKKPLVPIKKSPTVSSVAGNIFSGLKQKVASKSEHRTSSTNDSLDGIGSSKLIGNQVADNNERGIVGERIKRDSSEDFDHVERAGSILPDMRAGRVKAPKRRPPTNAIANTSGSGDSDHITYQQNGSNGDLEADARNDSSLDEDGGAKPKPRNWEKQKVPWMDELKASQAKKTSPGVESRSPESQKPSATNTNTTAATTTTSTTTTTTTTGAATVIAVAENETSEKFDMSKSFSSSYVSSSHHKKAAEMSNFEIRSNSVDVKGVSMAQTTSSIGSSGIDALHRKDITNHSIDNGMARSMSAIATSKISFSSNSSSSESSSTLVGSTATTAEESLKVRPTSVNLRNRSISPIGRSAIKSMHASSPPIATEATKLLPHHHHHHHNNNNDLPPPIPAPSSPAAAVVNADNVCSRLQELELKVARLEKLVAVQNHTIEELLRSVKDESDKVKTLKGELDKYAQCVTQV